MSQKSKELHSRLLEVFPQMEAIQQGKYCQYGESKIIDEIFDVIGTTNKFCVEFGAGTGYYLSNTRKLIDEGWDSLLMEGDTSRDWTVGQSGKKIEQNTHGGKYDPNIREEFVTAENVNELFGKYNVPENPDLVSIDLDGNDLWIWKALKYQPRVVVIEFNGCIPVGVSKTIKYNPEHQFGRNDYYGASFEALKKLGHEMGYTCVYQLKTTNMFFVKDVILAEYGGRHKFDVRYAAQQYHPPHPSGRPKEYPWVEY